MEHVLHHILILYAAMYKEKGQSGSHNGV